MKISDIRVIPNIMPKVDRTWKIAYGAVPQSQGIVVKLQTDQGHAGFGYTSTKPPDRFIPAGLEEAAMDRIIPYLIGQDPFNVEKILADMEVIPLSDLSKKASEVEWARIRAKSAVDLALHDVKAKALGIPLFQLLGGLVRDEVPIIRIIPIKEPDEMAKNAMNLCREGYKYIKIKLEGNHTKDIERVRAVRLAVGPDVHLTVDANQSYSTKGAIQSIKEMERYRVELIEQPVPETDLDGLVEVSLAGVAANCLVEAHESVETPENVFRLLKTDFAGCMNVSVILGGLVTLRTVVNMCKLAGVKCVITCIGSRILSAASIHFVASLSSVDYACQIGEFARFQNDPATGLEVENGFLRVPKGPGLGIEVNV